TPATLATKIQNALSNTQLFGAGNVIVTSSNGTLTDFDITFTGIYSGVPLSNLIVDASGLGGPTATTTITTLGSGNEVQVLNFNNITTSGATPTAGNFVLFYGQQGIGSQSQDVAFNADAIQQLSALQTALDAIFGGGNTKAWLMATNSDGTTAQVQVVFLAPNATATTGLFAGQDLQPLAIGSRHEAQVLQFVH